MADYIHETPQLLVLAQQGLLEVEEVEQPEYLRHRLAALPVEELVQQAHDFDFYFYYVVPSIVSSAKAVAAFIGLGFFVLSSGFA